MEKKLFPIKYQGSIMILKFNWSIINNKMFKGIVKINTSHEKSRRMLRLRKERQKVKVKKMQSATKQKVIRSELDGCLILNAGLSHSTAAL